jgi:L-lactate dehydrogenase complex protein LldG
MSNEAREEILRKLRKAPKMEVAPRPTVPPLNELSWDEEEMIRRFIENLTEQTGYVYRVADYAAAAEKLGEIAVAEKISKVMVSTDDVVTLMDLPSWGWAHGVEVMQPQAFEDRYAFKHAVFEQAQAGITGVDYAIAETGTLVLAHDKNQPRLVSLAPIIHIAIVPIARLRPVYESATDNIFGGESSPPGHVTFTTGPSMTGDIQGVQFKGMHGPKKVFAILVG